MEHTIDEAQRRARPDTSAADRVCRPHEHSSAQDGYFDKDFRPWTVEEMSSYGSASVYDIGGDNFLQGFIT